MSIEISTVSPRPTALRYGLIFGIGLVVLDLVLNLTGIADPTDSKSAGTRFSNCLQAIIVIVGVVMAINYHKKSDLGGYITLGRSIGVGTLTALIIALIVAAWTILYTTVIDPDMVEIIRDTAIEEAAKTTPEEHMDKAMPWINAFTSPVGMSLIVFFMCLFVGFFTSLITGAIVKKDPGMN